MAITAAYFTGELLIPGIAGSTYAEVQNLATLNAMIAKYEAKFLELLLGEALYAEYAAAIALNPTSGVWFDLKAQIYQTTPFYESPAANYIYFKFWKLAASTTLMTGEAQPRMENSDAISIGQKMVRAWNEMCDMVEDIRDYLDLHAADYATWGTEETGTFEYITIYGC